MGDNGKFPLCHCVLRIQLSCIYDEGLGSSSDLIPGQKTSTCKGAAKKVCFNDAKLTIGNLIVHKDKEGGLGRKL